LKPTEQKSAPSEASDKSPGTPSLFILFVGFGIVLLLWAAWPLIARYWLGLPGLSTSLAHTAQLGDTFGAINTLFSGLALAALLYAAHLQRHEIKLLKEEQTANRKVMQQQQKDMNMQATALQAQVDNAMFATMVAVLSDRLAAIKYRPKGIEIGAQEFSSYFMNKVGAWSLEAEVREFAQSHQKKYECEYEVAHERSFQALMIRYSDVLVPWFSVLHQILEWINEDEIARRRFCGILKAVHTEAHFCLIAAWAISDAGDARPPPNLKALIERYSLFSCWPRDVSAWGPFLRKRFEPEAFGN
jgi:hypothetical protein